MDQTMGVHKQEGGLIKRRLSCMPLPYADRYESPMSYLSAVLHKSFSNQGGSLSKKPAANRQEQQIRGVERETLATWTFIRSRGWRNSIPATANRPLEVSLLRICVEGN